MCHNPKMANSRANDPWPGLEPEFIASHIQGDGKECRVREPVDCQRPHVMEANYSITGFFVWHSKGGTRCPRWKLPARILRSGLEE